MPEGNTVWLTARTLRSTLAGHVLTHAEIRLAEFTTTDLVGQHVVDVVPRGKHLLMRLTACLAGLSLFQTQSLLPKAMLVMLPAKRPGRCRCAGGSFSIPRI